MSDARRRVSVLTREGHVLRGVMALDAAGGDADAHRRMSWRENLPETAPGPVTDQGEAPVVVLVAGLGLSGEFYEASHAPLAAAGVRLVVPDLPGWGRTPGPLTGISPEATATFLESFAEALAIRRAVWAGHSLGAQAVAVLAARRPDLAAGLVLVGPTGRPARFETPRQVLALTLEATRVSARVVRAVAGEYVRTPPSRYLGTWLRHAGHDLPAVLARVHCPVLILVGDNDPVCPAGYIATLARHAPRAAVTWVAGGTHALPRGSADAFNAALADFAAETMSHVSNGTAGDRPGQDEATERAE
ncbi:MAG TPA: alpha/beta hydrolase [Longimicrobiales bacterium]|nr:alpha/beta hydrolase [Longimicrobiales bacterium]